MIRIGKRAPIPCCRIETAEGIHGWGEATSPPTTPAIITQIRESGKSLIGKSAWNIEGHWTEIYTMERFLRVDLRSQDGLCLRVLAASV